MCTRESDGTYGSRRVHARAAPSRVIEVNIKRIERLMRAEKIQGAYVPSKRRRGGGDGVLGVDGVRAWPGSGQARLPARRARTNLWCSDPEADPDRRGGVAPRQRVGLLLTQRSRGCASVISTPTSTGPPGEQIFLREVGRQLRADIGDVGNVSKLLGVVQDIAAATTSDLHSVSAVLSLANTLRQVAPERIFRTTVDADALVLGGVDYEQASPAQLHAALERWSNPHAAAAQPEATFDVALGSERPNPSRPRLRPEARSSLTAGPAVPCSPPSTASRCALRQRCPPVTHGRRPATLRRGHTISPVIPLSPRGPVRGRERRSCGCGRPGSNRRSWPRRPTRSGSRDGATAFTRRTAASSGWSRGVSVPRGRG